MSTGPDDRDLVRVEADSAELEGPRDQAVTAVLEEGEQVERIWTAEDFGDKDWDHPDTRPRMRGWLHLFAFFGAIVAGAVLIPLAAVLGARAGFSVAVYCLTICGLFGISALYHRRRWSPRGWKIMKRLDHSMIFLFIAGTYTPFALLAVDEPLGYWVLLVVWAGAVAGVSLAVKRGRTLGVVGESGSGKSVTNLAIMGLARGCRITGEVLFEGRDLLKLHVNELREIDDAAARATARDVDRLLRGDDP